MKGLCNISGDDGTVGGRRAGFKWSARISVRHAKHTSACCRSFLRRFGHSGAAKELIDAPAVQLREAAMATGLLVGIKGVLIQATTGNEATDPLRSLIISLLQVCCTCLY